MAALGHHRPLCTALTFQVMMMSTPHVTDKYGFISTFISPINNILAGRSRGMLGTHLAGDDDITFNRSRDQCLRFYLHFHNQTMQDG